MHKPLLKAESNDLRFVQEMLQGDSISSIGVATILFNQTDNKYIMFEYLLCQESQVVTPYSSHPNRYWNLNAKKFKSLFAISQKLEAVLYLVNYALSGSTHEDLIKVIEVKEISKYGITKQEVMLFSREEFSNWYRQLNAVCFE